MNAETRLVAKNCNTNPKELKQHYIMATQTTGTPKYVHAVLHTVVITLFIYDKSSNYYYFLCCGYNDVVYTDSVPKERLS